MDAPRAERPPEAGGTDMPRAKKPRKQVATTEPGPDPQLPARRVMEAFLAPLSGGQADAALQAAQDLMYRAWETRSRPSRLALARRALETSPLCADAYVLLAEEGAKSLEEAK